MKKTFVLMAIIIAMLAAPVMAQEAQIPRGSLVVVRLEKVTDQFSLLQSPDGQPFNTAMIVRDGDTAYVIDGNSNPGWVKIDPDDPSVLPVDGSGWISVANVEVVDNVQDIVPFGRIAAELLALYRVPPSSDEMSYEVFPCRQEIYCIVIDGHTSLVNPFPDQWVDGETFLERRQENQIRMSDPEIAANPRRGYISIPPGNVLPGRVLIVGATLRYGPSVIIPVEQDAYTEAIAREMFAIPEGISNMRVVRSGSQTWFFYLEESTEQGAVSSFPVNNPCSNWVDGIRRDPGPIRPDYEDVRDNAVISIPPSAERMHVVAISARPCDDDQVNQQYGFTRNSPLLPAATATQAP